MPPVVQPVILAGGSGTRLWPMSRKLLPKQFLPLSGESTMLQQTVERAARLPGAVAPMVITNEEHRFLAAEQLRSAGAAEASIVLEPVARGTAPATALAALAAVEREPRTVLAVLPADHVIGCVDAFLECAGKAVGLAEQGFLVTLGIAPLGPETGYGYIVPGEPLGGGHRVRRFSEKPDAQRAESLIRNEGAYWNSGMFVFSAESFLAELARLQPRILDCARRAWAARSKDLDFIRPAAEPFGECPADSIDYAVMERTSSAAVVAGAFGWSDVGSWSSLWEIGSKDAAGNVGRGDVHFIEAANCYVRSERGMTAVLGVSDLVVIDSGDAVLVTTRARAQQVKDIVTTLAAAQRTEHISHPRVYRPWGYYESIDSGSGYQVKRLMVKPGEAISLQLHRKRAEHWVVVSGLARVTHGERVFDLARNESTYIPSGVKHRLENPGSEPLLLIEVQSGSYLGEDDIERFDDRYNRH